MIPGDILWSSLPVPALLIDRADRIRQTNPAAESFLNLSAKALEGASLWDKVMIDADLELAFARAQDLRSSVFINDVDVGSGMRAPTQCNVLFSPLNGLDDTMILMLSPREMAQRIVRNGQSHSGARSAIGMAEMLAHEIKNPLAGITGAAQLLSMGLSAEDRELTDLIVVESRRIVQLLEQVEQFGNLRPPVRAAVNIHDVLDRARQSASVGFGAHMFFIVDYDPSLPPALADADQLQQVFLNLLKNAAQAGAEGGSIRLRTFYDAALRVKQADGTQARLPLQIEIIDDGPGIPPDIMSDIFEPFVSGRENGTGLGLALVAKLIQDGGGWISVDSVPGKTVFRVSLPRAPEPAAPHDGET